MKNIKDQEDKGADLELQGNLTAKLLINAIEFKDIHILNEQQKRYITALAKWLCLIDAIDDYDDDNKQGRYNPLNNLNESSGFLNDIEIKGNFISKNYFLIARYYNYIYNDMKNVLMEIPWNNNEKEIMYIMTYHNMPAKFASVLKK